MDFKDKYTIIGLIIIAVSLLAWAIIGYDDGWFCIFAVFCGILIVMKRFLEED